MHRQFIATLCVTGLIMASGAAKAEDNPGAAKSMGQPASGAGHAKRHHRPAKSPDTPTQSGVAGKAASAAGAIRSGETVVKTDKTVNDNTMKILPP